MKSPLRAALLGCAAAWCLAIVAAPTLHLTPVYAFFSAICHQQSARSWHIDGEPLAVCIRCTSIYFGFLAGLFLLHTPNAKWFRIALAATAGQWLLSVTLIDSEVLRVLSGLALGLCAAPIVRTGVEQMFGRIAHEPM